MRYPTDQQHCRSTVRTRNFLLRSCDNDLVCFYLSLSGSCFTLLEDNEVVPNTEKNELQSIGKCKKFYRSCIIILCIIVSHLRHRKSSKTDQLTGGVSGKTEKNGSDIIFSTRSRIILSLLLCMSDSSTAAAVRQDRDPLSIYAVRGVFRLRPYTRHEYTLARRSLRWK